MFWRFEMLSTYTVINTHVHCGPPRNFGRHVWQPPQELVWQLYQKAPKGVQEPTPGLRTATILLLKRLHESAPRPGHRQHLLRHVHRMHACNCVRMKHWRRQAQPVNVLHNALFMCIRRVAKTRHTPSWITHRGSSILYENV